MRVSINLEAAMGFDWPLWKRYIPALEAAGFYTIFRSDHFPMGEPPETNAIELITSLTYIADHTLRANFGPLVSPLSFRDPVSLARQAMSLNDLSGGRMILGLGSGWNEPEHRQYGYELGDVGTRLDRLEEGLQVITALLRSEEPVSFEGRFYTLRGARLLPRPQQPTRILIGGTGRKRILPMVARYADLWNGHVKSPEAFKALNQRLDELIRAENRRPEEVKRTVMVPVLLYRSAAELDRITRSAREMPMFSSIDAQEMLGMYQGMGGILGAKDAVLEQMQAYAEAGVDEFVVQWFIPQYLEGVEDLGREILPYFAS